MNNSNDESASVKDENREIDTPWCPCQEDKFSEYSEDDMPFVADYLEPVKSHHYWKRKRQKARKNGTSFTMGVSPSTPKTRRGVKIIEKNFPDADLVCPCCGQEYEKEVKTTIREI
jgi:hypothetical protein